MVAEQSPPYSPSDRAAEASGKLAGLRILVVDDARLNLFLVTEIIEAAAGECIALASGHEALEWLEMKAGQFDAALVDIQMPDLDGLDLAREIRQSLGITDPPIIAFTAGIMREQTMAALAAGMNDVLLKPLNGMQLIDCLVYWCGRDDASAGRYMPGHRSVPDCLPDIAGIDRAHASATAGNDPDYFAEVLALFRQEFADCARQLRIALSTGDQIAAGRLLHSVRGAARQVGALGLARAAESLEKSIETDHDLEAPLASFEAHLQVVLSAVTV